ncbi:sugar transporter ERD6-like 7 isoform X2 [Malania oleifera]|uniref:sugar transporter ERD6-like 7 isoform X2 n=1 Tax=Malania oleifera TaxID=397392 RepID=UPI0025AEADC2|nr:sugar transporter ERD6-like 7 isoform X2 [Malania oleifera]
MAIKQDLESGEQGVQEQITEPLIQQEKSLANKGDGFGSDQTGKSSQQQVRMVYLSTFVAVCGSFEFGSCAGYSSPTQTAIREDLNLSLAEYSLFGSILTFGAMIGAITSGPIADFIGRKGGLRVATAFCVAGWLAIYFAKGAWPLDIGRLATGYGMGVFSYVVMICAGVSVAFIIGTVLTWRALALTGLVPCFVLLVGLFLIPESPRWLAKTGHQKEFEAALQKLRGKDADISEELNEIKDYIETLQSLPKAKILDLFQRRYLLSVTIGVGLMVFQQFGGINGICFYVSSIFESAGFSSNIGTITYACLQVVVTVLGATLIDRTGRKPLLLISASGLVIGCVLTGIAFYMKVHELSLKAVPALAVTGILVYIGFFSLGMGAVPWVIMSEIFPINVKGVAGSIATLVNWFGAWTISYTYNFLISWSSYGTFALYAVINALAILFVIVVVPETKGRTLEQLQAAINK